MDHFQNFSFYFFWSSVNLYSICHCKGLPSAGSLSATPHPPRCLWPRMAPPTSYLPQHHQRSRRRYPRTGSTTPDTSRCQRTCFDGRMVVMPTPGHRAPAMLRQERHSRMLRDVVKSASTLHPSLPSKLDMGSSSKHGHRNQAYRALAGHQLLHSQRCM